MEQTLFIIVGAVAVVTAAMMLVSENAVHSALFLILNFACIAFFFLLLHAPFLAMVQITVYAGAIMVLFLFVIMLLGAERVAPEEQPRFRWLTPAAVVLAVIFLVTASVAIIHGEIDLTEPLAVTPQVRVIHALEGIPAVDVYLDDQQVARSVAFGKSTDFKPWDSGRYVVTLFAAGADPQTDAPLAKREVDLNSGEVISLTAVGTPSAPLLVPASEDMTAVEDKDKLRVVAINGVPDRAVVDVLDVTDSDRKEVLIDNLAYGQASKPVEVEKGTYTIGFYPDNERKSSLLTLKNERLKPGTAVLWVFVEQQGSDKSVVNRVIDLKTNARPSFGGPQHVGQLLFTRYLLPFEMVALVLLAAMIGAIVLTHEAQVPRRRNERRLANPPAEPEQPVSANSAGE